MIDDWLFAAVFGGMVLMGGVVGACVALWGPGIVDGSAWREAGEPVPSSRFEQRLTR